MDLEVLNHKEGENYLCITGNTKGGIVLNISSRDNDTKFTLSEDDCKLLILFIEKRLVKKP